MRDFDFRSTGRLCAVALLCLAASGCPASTTLQPDGGTGPIDAGNDATTSDDDAATIDGGSTDDAGATTDAATTSDTGAPSTWRSCGQSSDCVLEQNDCCGWCGMGHLSDVDAVNSAHLDEHAHEVCPVPTPCPACAGGPLDPQVVAVCQAGSCQAIDLGTMPIAACTDSSECEVAYGNCCGCSGTDDEVIAVRTADGRPAIDALFCAGGACPLDCAPRTPPGWSATCDAGRCVPVMVAP